MILLWEDRDSTGEDTKQHQKPTNGICFITCLDAVAFVCRCVYVCACVWVRGCAIYVHFQLHLNDVEYISIF